MLQMQVPRKYDKTKSLDFFVLSILPKPIPGKSLYRGRGYTACTVVNPLKKWLFREKDFVLFLRQPSPQLVDCTCGTIPFPLYREFPAYTTKFCLTVIKNRVKVQQQHRNGRNIFFEVEILKY
jgi:hypothetical protein